MLPIMRKMEVLKIDNTEAKVKGKMVPIWEKYMLTVDEAVQYFGIGEIIEIVSDTSIKIRFKNGERFIHPRVLTILDENESITSLYLLFVNPFPLLVVGGVTGGVGSGSSSGTGVY